MDNLLDKLLEMGLGQGVSKSRDEMIKADDTYNKDYKDLEQLEERYEKLDVPVETRRVINDYIACKDTVSERAEDISYIAGIKDAVLFMNHMGLIKSKEE